MGEYHAVIILVLFSMFVMLVVSFLDKMLPVKSRQGFMLFFSTIIILSFIEWVGFYMSKNNIEIRSVSILLTFVLFTIIPTLPMVIANSVGEVKFDKIYKILIFANLFIQLLTLKYEFMYSYDENDVYQRGDYYFIYLTFIFISLLLLFINCYQLAKKYQHQGDWILGLIGILLLVGINIQVKDPSIHSVWLAVSFCSIMTYIYFYTLISRNDQLTLLLNRKCFDNQLQRLKKDAIIIYLDVNNFKSVNDNFGHNYGDYCLQMVGRKIKKVYNVHGTSYRIGGDEFAVILTKDLSSVEHINSEFIKIINLRQKEEPNIPSVSVGYGHFYKKDNDTSSAIEEADKMMYENKRKNKLDSQTKINA